MPHHKTILHLLFVRLHISYIILLALFPVIEISSQTSVTYAHLDSLFQINLENHPDKAMEYILQMEQLTTISLEQKLDVMEYKANCLLLLDQFDQAMELRYKLLAQYEQDGNHEKAVQTMFNLGNQYFQMSDHTRSLDMFQKAKAKTIQNGNPDDSIRINLEIGLQLAGLGQFDEGIKLMLDNLPLAKKTLSEEDWAIGLDNLSNIYNEKGDYQNALRNELQVYQTDFVKSSIQTKIAVNQHLTEIYINLKQYKEAQYHLDSAFHYGKILRANDWLYECYKNQFQIDQALGKNKSALDNHIAYMTLKDSVYQQQYDTKMSAMANYYELTKKQGQINELEYQGVLVQR